MDRPLMRCGCVAQGTCSSKDGVAFDPPVPACVIHDCLELAEAVPDLTGRVAQCAYSPAGHAPQPSSFDLAFFEFLGEGSREATDICQCGFSRVAHEGPVSTPLKCKEFIAKGAAEFDRYYCGCLGWD